MTRWWFDCMQSCQRCLWDKCDVVNIWYISKVVTIFDALLVRSTTQELFRKVIEPMIGNYGEVGTKKTFFTALINKVEQHEPGHYLDTTMKFSMTLCWFEFLNRNTNLAEHSSSNPRNSGLVWPQVKYFHLLRWTEDTTQYSLLQTGG